MIVSYLIRIASAASLNSVEPTLGCCPNASDPSLAAMQELILQDREYVSIRPALRGDRAMVHHILVLFDRREIGIVNEKPEPWSLGAFLYSQHLPNNLAFILEQFDSVLSMNDLPLEERASAIRRWQMPQQQRENAMGQLLLPAVEKVSLAELRYRAKCICTAAGIACERYRLKHGKWPAHLHDLAEFGIPQRIDRSL